MNLIKLVGIKTDAQLRCVCKFWLKLGLTLFQTEREEKTEGLVFGFGQFLPAAFDTRTMCFTEWDILLYLYHFAVVCIRALWMNISLLQSSLHLIPVELTEAIKRFLCDKLFGMLCQHLNAGFVLQTWICISADKSMLKICVHSKRDRIFVFYILFVKGVYILSSCCLSVLFSNPGLNCFCKLPLYIFLQMSSVSNDVFYHK